MGTREIQGSTCFLSNQCSHPNLKWHLWEAQGRDQEKSLQVVHLCFILLNFNLESLQTEGKTLDIDVQSKGTRSIVNVSEKNA